MLNPSEKTKGLKQSSIRAASVRCAEVGGINLGQGVCDLPIEDVIKKSADDAILHDKSLYSACEGILPLRQAVAKKLAQFNKITVDPAKELLITHGSTGAFVCAVTTLFNPGDEVILFEPFYGYHKNILELKGMQVKSVPMSLQDLTIDFDRLKQSISSRTKGIVICTPCNPTGKVFTREELLQIGALAEQYNLWVITDEIYEYITYPGYEHISFGSLEDFSKRTITISGFSKTYNMTGWRLGYVAGPAHMIEKMALVQDLLYVCPATPLQHAVIEAFKISNDYYEQMRRTYLQKRDFVVGALKELGFKVTVPQGAYYLMTDFSQLGFKNDEEAANFLLEKAKVAAVRGSAFYLNPENGKNYLRFCYALRQEKLTDAMSHLKAALA